MAEAGIERKGTMYRRTLVPTGTLLHRLRMEKGGQPKEGNHTQARARNSLGFQAREESADEKWRPEVRGAV